MTVSKAGCTCGPLWYCQCRKCRGQGCPLGVVRFCPSRRCRSLFAVSVCVRLHLSTEFVEGGAFVKIVLLLLLLLLYVSCLSHHGRPGSYQSVNDKARVRKS